MADNESTGDEALKAQLRRFLQSIDLSGRAILPRSNEELLQTIVEAAARIFGAAAASIALVNESRQTLEFKVSFGAGNEEVVGMSIPMDKGIAGYVVMSGQPIAISNVQQDARFNQDFAQSTGYVPHSILATPLLSGDRVIGVMEVLDKISAPSFGIQDMELLGLFARQAALAIDLSQQTAHIAAALVAGLKQLASAESLEFPELIASLSRGAELDSQAMEALAVAELFNDLVSSGDAERQACLRILQTFADYSRSRQRKRL
jgi:GAF domain-containing protein